MPTEKNELFGNETMGILKKTYPAVLHFQSRDGKEESFFIVQPLRTDEHMEVFVAPHGVCVVLNRTNEDIRESREFTLNEPITSVEQMLGLIKKATSWYCAKSLEMVGEIQRSLNEGKPRHVVERIMIASTFFSIDWVLELRRNV